MKKLKKYLIIIVIAAISGLFFSFLKQNGYWYKLSISLKSLKWYFYIVLPLVYFFLTILIHELGHLFSFLFSKIKIRALIVWIFTLVKKENNKWKFSIEFKNCKFIGGIVVPNLSEITSNEKFDEIRKKFKKALIAGPNTTIFYYIVSSMLFIVMWFFTSKTVILAPLFINFILTTFLTVIIILSSKIHTDELYGDYPAHKYMKEDNKFALIQLLQYSDLSTNETEKTHFYFYNYLTDLYNEEKLSYSFFDLVLVSNFLHLYIYSDDKNNETIDKIINYYDINKLAKSKHGLELSYLISASYYKKDELKKSYETFNLINTNKNNNIELNKQLFLNKQYAHLINKEDNELFFINNKKTIEKEYFVLYPIINMDKIIEDLKYSLEFKKYYTTLYCNVDNNKV